MWRRDSRLRADPEGRAFGADDGNPPRTPSAWIRLPLSPGTTKHAFGVDDAGRLRPPFPILFPVWVTSTEHYWATSREAEGQLPEAAFEPLKTTRIK